MSKEDKINLLASWLEGRLTPEQQKQFEQVCLHDKHFAKQVERANAFALMSETDEAEPAPEWNREASFNFKPKAAWWHWHGLPLASMACSVFAILLVVTGFNMEYQQGRFSFGFGKGLSPLEIESLVAAKVDKEVSQRVNDYQQDNQALLAQYLDALQDQQQQSSSQLTEYVLTSSRQERREDFAEFIKFINQQRQDDQVFYARQISELQDEISASTGQFSTPIVPVSDLSINDE